MHTPGAAMCADVDGTVWAPFPTKTTIRFHDVRRPVMAAAGRRCDG